MSSVFIISSVLLTLAGIGAAFIPKGWSAAIAFLALPVLYFMPGLAVPVWTLIFWGVAAAICWGLYILLPAHISKATAGVGYITVAALAGTLVGLLVSQAGMIIGSVTGAFCGAMAYSRTPAGRQLEFPSSRFINYLCAKGLPAVITTCIAGTTASLLYVFYGTL